MLRNVTEKIHLYLELEARDDPWQIGCDSSLAGYSRAEIRARIRELESP